MEKKRKLPPRAAAREQSAKKRDITPRERSETPVVTPLPVKEPAPPPPPPASLPTSVQTGKALPTTEEQQAEDLSASEYQSITESGVLAESLTRSRHKWLNEGLFEKYWTKPHKRKGVTVEEPKNPPKDSMTKVGTVSIVIEPHIIEATMYTVKDPKPKLPPQPQYSQSTLEPKPLAQLKPPQQRPIIQYGPPNGAMPPPPSPAVAKSGAAPSSPAPAPVQQLPRPVSASPGPSPKPEPLAQQPPLSALPATPSTNPTVAPGGSAPAASPLQRPQMTPPAASAAQTPQPAVRAPSTTPWPQPRSTPTPPVAGPSKPPTPGAAAPKPAAKSASNDPVIALLAQKATHDPALRDLMKRVAIGQAKEGEVEHFQKIIDQLHVEYRRSGGQQGPSADRLLVDGRTVKYFADEVRAILDIVLASNPHQKSADLRPPPGSDALVVLLVKSALETQRTRDMIKRIADDKPGFTDSTDLKVILERLIRDAKLVQKASPAPAPPKPATAAVAQNGQLPVTQPKTAPLPAAHPQSLRSKGPPPVVKPDISAVLLDFGSGDRYLFPKFSIVEFIPTPVGQQVVASFLIVRKGSTSEYGGNPELDYYQPVTIRLSTQTGRILENLARVVAPVEEVRRYMDDVMDNMTRAEYVLLAMRLPRPGRDSEKEDSVESKTNGAPLVSIEGPLPKAASERAEVLWTMSAAKAIEEDAAHRRRSEVIPRQKATDMLEEAQENEWRELVRSATKKDAAVV